MLWLFTPWNDKKDFEKYKKDLMNSHAWLGGFGMQAFFPARWIARFFVLMVLALILTPVILSMLWH